MFSPNTCTTYNIFLCTKWCQGFGVLKYSLCLYKLLNPYGYSMVHLNNIFHTPFPLFGSSRNACRNDWNNGWLGRLEYIQLDISLLTASVSDMFTNSSRHTKHAQCLVDDEGFFFHDTLVLAINYTNGVAKTYPFTGNKVTWTTRKLRVWGVPKHPHVKFATVIWLFHDANTNILQDRKRSFFSRNGPELFGVFWRSK